MIGDRTAVALWTRNKWRILLAILAAVPLGLLTALAFAPPGTKLIAFFLAVLIYQNTIAPWTVVEVPLPEGSGDLKFYRKYDGAFQGSFYRQVEIRLAKGRKLFASKLMVNNGGTEMFQPLACNQADTASSGMYQHCFTGFYFVCLTGQVLHRKPLQHHRCGGIESN